MPSTAVVTAVITALVLAAGSSCQGSSSISSSPSPSSGGGTSSSVSCTNNVCEVEVAGDPTNSRLTVLGRDLRFRALEEGAVVLAVSGAERRIPAGATESVGGLAIRVVEARQGQASLELRRS